MMLHGYAQKSNNYWILILAGLPVHQYPNGKENFGVFLDSMPDTWGRTLMKSRAALQVKETGKAAAALYDIDFLLGVYDETRMGALRFKLDTAGPFLDDNHGMAVPPWAA